MPQITIDNTLELKRYEFSGSALPSDWNIISLGAGQTVSVASSILTISSGTTASATTTIRCMNAFRIKSYVRFIISLSQRIVNQNFYLEITNDAGTTFARYDFNGATATSAQVQTGNQGTSNTAVTVTVPTTASYGVFDIYADTNDVIFSSVAANSNSVKSGIGSFDRYILDPDEDYYIQLRVVNGATPPASSTNLLVDAVVFQDLTGVKVDIIRGDGTAALTNAAPVQVVNTPTIGLAAGTNNIGDVDILSIVPGTAATNLGKAVDGAAGATDTGVLALAVRDDALATLTPVDNDYTQLRVNSTGRLWTTAVIDTALPVGSNTIGNVNAIQSGTWTVQPGNTANTTPWLIRHSEQLGTATALGALNANISQALLGNNGVAAVITATATPSGITLTPQVSYDGGTNWVNAKFFDAATETALATLTSFTVGASYIIAASSGATNVRVIATAWVSGSVTVRLSATNAIGLVSLLSGAEHDAASGSFVQLMGAVASSTAPTAVSANGDAVRLWATTNGALNVADGGSSLTVDGTVAATQSGTWTVQPGNTANTTPWLVTNRANIFYNESTTNQTASATVTGTSRDVAIAAGSIQPFVYFKAFAFADVAGTLRIEVSNDNTTWRRATVDTAVGANTPVILTVPVLTRYHRVVYVNGASPQTAFMLNSGYSVA